jgi:hypothetical protein
MHRMDWTRGIFWILHLRQFLSGSALHPRWRARGRGIIRGRRGPILIALGGTRLYLMVGPAHAGEWIVLADQPRELRQWIAFGGPCRRVLAIATIMIVVRWKRSILISISHRDDACPSGKPPTHT